MQSRHCSEPRMPSHPALCIKPGPCSRPRIKIEQWGDKVYLHKEQWRDSRLVIRSAVLDLIVL